MTHEEKDYWGNTPQHTIDFANRVCAENRKRIAMEKVREAKFKSDMLKGADYGVNKHVVK